MSSDFIIPKGTLISFLKESHTLRVVVESQLLRLLNSWNLQYQWERPLHSKEGLFIGGRTSSHNFAIVVSCLILGKAYQALHDRPTSEEFFLPSCRNASNRNIVFSIFLCTRSCQGIKYPAIFAGWDINQYTPIRFTRSQMVSLGYLVKFCLKDWNSLLPLGIIL